MLTAFVVCGCAVLAANRGQCPLTDWAGRLIEDQTRSYFGFLRVTRKLGYREQVTGYREGRGNRLFPVTYNLFPIMVGTARFELATPCTPSKCATRLRYVPIIQ